jgi:hypothetical protein
MSLLSGHGVRVVLPRGIVVFRFPVRVFADVELLPLVIEFPVFEFDIFEL